MEKKKKHRWHQLVSLLLDFALTNPSFAVIRSIFLKTQMESCHSLLWKLSRIFYWLEDKLPTFRMGSNIERPCIPLDLPCLTSFLPFTLYSPATPDRLVLQINHMFFKLGKTMDVWMFFPSPSPQADWSQVICILQQSGEECWRWLASERKDKSNESAMCHE